MARTAANVIDQCEILLQDTSNVRWSAPELLEYLNMAQMDIAIRTEALGITPAYAKTVPVKLKKGIVQKLPEDGIRIMDVRRNLGRTWITATSYNIDDAVYLEQAITVFADSGDDKTVTVTCVGHGLSVGDFVYIDGTTSYNGAFEVVVVPTADTFKINALFVANDATGIFIADSLRYVCLTAHTAGTFATDLAASKWEASPLKSGSNIEQWSEYNFEMLVPNWQSADPNDNSEIAIWMPTTSDQKSWYCYPPQPNSTGLIYVEITYSAIPKYQDSAAPLLLGDIYASAIQDYILYRAYARDDDVLEGATRSEKYMEAYLNNPVFGVK